MNEEEGGGSTFIYIYITKVNRKRQAVEKVQSILPVERLLFELFSLSMTAKNIYFKSYYTT